MEIWRDRNLNILLINYEYPPIGGGASNATKELGAAMSRLGHNVVVLTSRTPSKIGYSIEGKIKVYRLRTLRRLADRSTVFEMFIFVLFAIVSSGRICSHNKIDAAICFFTLPVGPIGLFLKTMYGIPYVISLRGGDVPGLVPELALHHRVLQRLRRKVLKNAVSIVANSWSLAGYSEKADPFTVKVIPNGVDTEFYRPLTDSAIRYDNNELRLLFVGRFQVQKNIPGLIRILAKAKSDYGIDFSLTLVGDGPGIQEAMEVAELHGLKELIEWCGWVDKQTLKNVYQNSDCLINLSFYEGSPNVVLEAMSCGLVVIASDIEPHRELIQHDVNGILVPLDRPDELIRQLIALARMPARRTNLARSARKETEREWPWSKSACEYVRLIEIGN